MGLFTPVYMKGGLNLRQQRKALDQVAAISSPDKLCRIAMEAPVNSVGMKAAECLNDAGMLRRVAWEAPSLSVRRVALGKLTDADVLVSLAVTEPCLFDSCLTRLKELGEKQAVAKLFIEYSVADETQSIHAIDREYKSIAGKLRDIADQEIIEAVAKSARKAELRAAAVELLKNPEVLAGIARTDKASHVQLAAIVHPRFSDINVLSGIANDAQLGLAKIRWSAALRLTELSPEQAVRPVVALLMQTGGSKENQDLIRAAVQFLETRYKGAGQEERKCIATLPNRKYGYDWKGPCWH